MTDKYFRLNLLLMCLLFAANPVLGANTSSGAQFWNLPVSSSAANSSVIISTRLIAANDPEDIEDALTNGADANGKYKTMKGLTPLMFAIKNNAFEAVKSLAKYGADIHARDDHGLTPLMYAVQNHFLKASEFLIQKGSK